jgi:phosphoribosylformylglycinamidine (FGAM) synthase-like amidotransferase family enzyme
MSRTPLSLRMLAKALRHNGLNPNGGKITGVGERHNLANWWFAHPERFVKNHKYGVQMHGVKKWGELLVKDWKWRHKS